MRVRCQACEVENDEGAAFCAGCAAPLTAYGGAYAAEADPARTAQRLAELDRRPPAVNAVAVLDVIAAMWPLWATARAALSRPRLTEDAVNYVSHAFGGLSAVLTAAVMLPLAAALIGLAWGTYTQRAWAWYANACLMGIALLAALGRFGADRFGAMVMLVASVTIAYGWLQDPVRRWFGVRSSDA
ncbi:MAG: hypothetical protein FJX72_10120 [Armatimonadetes bacterium]|nr:hypothetical protein [Armatimonadota bacterium]